MTQTICELRSIRSLFKTEVLSSICEEGHAQRRGDNLPAIADDLRLSAIELRARYAAREISPVEVLDATVKRIEEVNPTLNALVTPTVEAAREQALRAERTYSRGAASADEPLLGIPITVKDTIATKGIRTTAGSLLLSEDRPRDDAPAVERLLRAGVVLLGKTNTSEFGWKGETSNRVFGTTRNPWNTERTPGGSSGGAGACVAAGIGPVGIGTDGGGSIRIPAAFCGVFGFKATFGVIPYAPNGPLESLGHTGILSRSVEDAALFLTTMAGVEPRDRLSQNCPRRDWLSGLKSGIRGLRVAWSGTLGYAPVEAEVAARTRDAARVLEEAGATVEDVDVSFADPHEIFFVFFATANSGMHRHEWPAVRERIDPGRVEMVEAGFAMSAADVGEALIRRARWSEQMVKFMEPYDLLLTPTVPLTAFEAGLDGPGEVDGVPTPHLAWSPFTYPMNLTGQPAASIPCGVAENGLPIGLQVVGKRHDDATVLRACAMFETLRPWAELGPKT